MEKEAGKFAGLLWAAGPDPDCAGDLSPYDRLIGSWSIESEWFGPDGTARRGSGEWHFFWVLGGRGVQDLLFGAGSPAKLYGTTLRCWDAAARVWRISWMQPGGGEFANLVGRADAEGIVNEGQGIDAARRERWSFREIKPASFLWTGERSLDGGASWVLEQRMRASRLE